MGNANKSLTTNATTGSTGATAALANANSLYGTVAPQLINQSINPQGYSPAETAAQTTAAMQSAGGSGAGAAGQGKLYEMRTKNAGAAGNAIAQGQQQAGQQLGQAAVQQQVRNADLKQKQRTQAQQGLLALNSTELGSGTGLLNSSNSALNDVNQYDENSPWLQVGKGVLASGAGSGNWSV